jgi:hypothetical protein
MNGVNFIAEVHRCKQLAALLIKIKSMRLCLVGADFAELF